MDKGIKECFVEKWNNYFQSADLPIVFFYKDSRYAQSRPETSRGHRCMISDLARVRRGKDVSLDVNTIACGGGRRYLGFAEMQMPDFEHFLSCGIPGKLDGERYKKSPDLVKEYMKHQPPFHAPGRFITFKRWDRLEEGDRPSVVIFFAPPDVLSGLFTLANFDEPGLQGVIAPFGSGCASIVDYPYRELQTERPRAVLGMFDVSARPFVPAGLLTFSVPWPKFERMMNNMDESFLIAESWGKVKNRIKREASR
ncbi:MAG TPA: DUF169 domain-containing protein [Syntrophales bacterium]|nr:DUF169 domain-containing protein [Syntrophales bacterium]